MSMITANRYAYMRIVSTITACGLRELNTIMTTIITTITGMKNSPRL